MALRVDAVRMLRDLRKLAEFGAAGVGKGVRRIAFSPEDIAARLWLADCFREAGLEPGMDAVGNVYGCARDCDRALLIGSHTDTVPTGGWLDGSLGVVYGLEIARRLSEEGLLDDVGVDVVSFQDEEGTYLGWLGSRFLCGDIADDQIEAARDPADHPLREALARLPEPFGPPLQLDRYIGYFEPHIEQGPILERTGTAIGLVTSIVGIRNHTVRFFGRADHAGTTPMDMRVDAGAQLFGFVSHFRQALEGIRGPHTVWNFGNARFRPGAGNVVPAFAELLVQYRDPQGEVLSRIDAAMEGALATVGAAYGRAAEVLTAMKTEPVHLDAAQGAEIELAAVDVGVSSIAMPSGAGHDAAALGRHLPSAMLFVPSIQGRSHSFDEDTNEQDIIVGANVALNAARRLLQPTQGNGRRIDPKRCQDAFERRSR